MRTYQENAAVIESAKRSDLLSAILLAATPLWRAQAHFSQATQTVAHVPAGIMSVLPVAPLLQNYFKQTYDNKLNQLPGYAELKQEIETDYHSLPPKIKKHAANIKKQNDLLQRLEEELIEKEKDVKACVAIQTKISKALKSLSDSTQAVEPYETTLHNIEQKQQKLDALAKEIHDLENVFSNFAREANLQWLNKLSNVLLLLSVASGVWSGGLTTLLREMAIDFSVYFALSMFAEKDVKKRAFQDYQNNPEGFNPLYWARVDAFTKVVAGYASTSVAKILNDWIAPAFQAPSSQAVEKFSPQNSTSPVPKELFKEKRVKLKDLLSPEKANAHTAHFLEKNPTLIIRQPVQPGKSFSLDNVELKLVDAKNNPIEFVAGHSGDIQAERAQFHRKIATGKNLDIFVSTRGMPYISISKKAPIETQPTIPATETSQSSNLVNTASQLLNAGLNIGFLSAIYAVVGPMSAFGAALLSQVTHALTAEIPDDIQKSVNQHYANQLQLACLPDVSKNQAIDVDRVIVNFHKKLDLKNFIENTFSTITTSQKQYVYDAFTTIFNARLNSWKTVVQDTQALLKKEGVVAGDTLSQPLIDSFTNPVMNSVALVTASATKGMKEAASFSWALSTITKGLDSSIISQLKSYEGEIFQPNYINNVLSELKSYASDSASQVENRLLAALNAQLINGAVEIQKAAIDYVLENAPGIVKLVESISTVQQFFNKQIHNFEKDPVEQVSTLICDVAGKEACDSFLRYTKIFASDIHTDDQKLSAFVKEMGDKAVRIFNLNLQQNLSPAQKLAYAQDLQSFSIDIGFASTIAGNIFGSKMAGEIQAAGQVTVGLIATLSSAMKMGSVMSDIGQFAAKIMPVLSVVSAVLQIFSIFGGGKSEAQKTAQMMQQYMQVILQQLYTIEKMIVDVYKAIGQLDSTMIAGFTQILKNLQLLFKAAIQGEEIDQELIEQTQIMIRSLCLQNYAMDKAETNQNFLDAKKLASVMFRSEGVPTAYRNRVLQNALVQSYLHSEVTSKGDDRRNALTDGANQQSLTENVERQMEATTLGLIAPENSIGFFQSEGQAILSKQFPKIPNMLPWLKGAKTFYEIMFRYGSEKFLLGADVMTSDQLKTAMQVAKFTSALRTSKAFWENIIAPYSATLNNFDDYTLAQIWQNAWEFYVPNSEFMSQYVQAQQQAQQTLTQEVKNSQPYDQTAMENIFPGLYQYSPNPYSAPTTYYSLVASLGDILQAVLSHPYRETVLNAIAQFSPGIGIFPVNNNPASKYRVIAFNVGSIKGPAVDFTPIVNTPIEVVQANLTNAISNISYSYAFNISAQPHHVDIAGTYFLPKEKRMVTFFQGRFIYSPELTNGIAGRMIMTAATASNLFSPTPPSAALFNCTVQLCAESDLVSDNCIANCNTDNGWVGPLPFASYENVPYTLPMPPAAMILLGYSDWTGHSNACDCSFYIGVYFRNNPDRLPIYIKKVKEVYQALLINSLFSLYGKNNTTPIENTAPWETERQHLQSLIKAGNVINGISEHFFDTVFANPEIPAYKIIAAILTDLSAAYNVVYGFIQLVLGDYVKGTHPAHEKLLCQPINPWKSNGTHFEDQNGVAMNVVPGNFTTMYSYFALPLQHKELRIVWSPFNHAHANMGLQLGDKKIVAIDPSVNVGEIYYTRIVQRHPNQYEIITTLNHFGGTPVGKPDKWNTTETQAKLSAFVQSDDATQGIRIANATSLQLNTTVATTTAAWNSVNTPSSKNTVFSENNVTFFNTNQSDPVGYSQLATTKTVPTMNTKIFIAWQADAGVRSGVGFHKKPYNMTVGINVGQQNGVAEFRINDKQFHSNTTYYSTITVTPETIHCVTCRGNFDNAGGVVITNSTQNNNFAAADSSELAIRISKSNAPDGHQSVTLQPVRVIGFETSVLPEPMPANHWQAQNSSQGIIKTPRGLTITAPSAASATLISAKEHSLRYREIMSKWKVDGNATISLQLSGNTIATFTAPEADKWFYTRVVIFNNTVEITTANEQYDLNPAAVNVTQIDTDAQNVIGNIAWVVNSNTKESVSFTLSECLIQDAANTILSKIGAGLMSGINVMYEMLQNGGSLETFSHFIRLFRKRCSQLLEILQHIASQQTAIDPNLSKAIERLVEVQQIIVKSNVNPVTFNNHHDYPDAVDFTKTISKTKTQTVSESGTQAMSASRSVSMDRSDSATAAHSASATATTSLTETKSATQEMSMSPSESETHSRSASATETKPVSEQEQAKKNEIKIIGIVLGSLMSALIVGGVAFVLINRKKSNARRQSDADLEEGNSRVGENSHLLFNNKPTEKDNGGRLEFELQNQA